MNWIPFLIYIVSSVYSPGPVNIMSLNTARTSGYKNSLFFGFGAYLGIFTLMSISGIVNAYLSKLLPLFQPYIIWIGAFYLLWLAFRIVYPKNKTEQNIKDTGELEDNSGETINTDQNTKANKASLFKTGLLIQLLNIKVILFSLIVMGTFVIPNFNNVILILLISALIATIGFSAMLVWAICGIIFQKHLEKYDKIVNVILAVMLVYCAISLVI